MWITIVYLSQEQYYNYWKEIEASNLPKTMKWDLRDLLRTAREHTEMARKMGWIHEPAAGS